MREQRSLLRGINLRSNSSAVSAAAFASRRQYLVSAYKDGIFLKDPENRGKPAGNPMTDPAAMEGMMGMMKGNMAMMIPQTLIMSWINAFFAGFVISTSSTTFDACPSSMAGTLTRHSPNSEAPVPPDDPVQVNVAVRCCNTGFGRAVGFEAVMVYPEPFRAAGRFHIYPRQ